MSGFALTIVLVAAFLHASWNAVVKAATDRAVVLAAVSATHATLGFVLVFFATPPSHASWTDSPFGYMGWLFLLEFPVTLFVLFRRRRAIHTIDRKTVVLGLVGGLGAVSAYGLVIYAKTIAPLGAVSAVRESSVIIAALIGLFIFGERPWPARIVSAVIVACGVIALAFSG